ncbi:MAG: hypothetical protein K0R39_2696 [Symbiobacteriaceae bacterium]|nr:hypothetical protein [Symbiobacteriaceae bacterium]
MIRRVSLLLLTFALLLSAVACSKPSQPQLSWDGQNLVGAPFTELESPHLTVHFTAPTTSAGAEAVAAGATNFIKQQKGWGRVSAAERVHVWILPAGYRWPKGLAAPPPGRQVRAAAPMTVVAGEVGTGLPEAIAVAVTQGPGSPVFAVDWLHEGTGAVMSIDPLRHPGANLKRAGETAGSATAMLAQLEEPAPEKQAKWQAAATALATLVMDRWGVAWANHSPGGPKDLTPGAALLWATGAPDRAAGTGLWQERLDQASRQVENIRLQSIADMSPVRVEPKLDRTPPGPGPNDNYSPHSYDIAARYDPETNQVTADQYVTWQNGEAIPIDTLYFNLWPNAEQYTLYGAAMVIHTVTVDGATVPHTARGLDLTVPLGRAVAPGQSVRVGISFATTLPGIITPRVLGQTAERFNLTHWFPLLAVLDDRGWNLHAFPEFPGEPYSENASFHVRLDVPAGTVMAATGRPVGRTEQAGRWVYEWSAPNVKDWIASGSDRYIEAARTVGDVTIRVLDQNRTVAETILLEAERTLKLFEAQFGAYPYTDLVVVPCCAWVEFPGLFYTEAPSSQRGNWWHTVLYHELAHQWFYGSVGNDQYAEAWLDEGFARYGERYALREFGYADQLQDIRSRTIPDQVRVNSPTLDFNIYGGYTPAVYDLGAVLLEDLEELLGAKAFRQLLHQYTETYRFKTATTADFIRLAEAVAGRDLSQFFREHKVAPDLRAPYRPTLPLGTVRAR